MRTGRPVIDPSLDAGLPTRTPAFPTNAGHLWTDSTLACAMYTQQFVLDSHDLLIACHGDKEMQKGYPRPPKLVR